MGRNVSLTVAFPIMLRIYKWVIGEEHKGGETSHTKSQSGSEKCWLCEAIRSSGNVISKPQRRISVEEDELTVDHGSGRERVVRVCSCFCHIPFRVSALGLRAYRECRNVYYDVSYALDGGSVRDMPRLP